MRARGALATAVVVVVLSTVACGGGAEQDSTWSAGSPPVRMSPTPTAVRPLSHGLGPAPTQEPTADPPGPAPGSGPPAGSGPRPEPEPEPEAEALPPPPRYEGECIGEYDGGAESHGRVAAALGEAASRVYWPTSAPDIRVPEDLLRAVAWQESGWQTNIISCDGGIGLMQVMPATADWMNTRFGQSYDVRRYTDNAYLGATFLAWLTKYIGDWHFDADYSLDPGACADHLDPCLLNAVIAAYNFGPGAVAPTDGEITIPNPRYVDNVRTLMTTCECLSY